ncbi:MAG: cytochrome c1 [Pseudomonadota bacterium]
MKRFVLAAIAALGLAGPALAAGDYKYTVTDYDFSFEGPFGSYDQDQLQRGLQVYTEICAGCHGLVYVPFRALEDLGYTDAEVRAYAANYFVPDTSAEAEPGDEREAIPTDYFPASMAEGAPDLSLMAKARAGFHGPLGTGINQFMQGMGGAEYIASLLAGYTGEEKEEAGAVFYQNKAYPGEWIAMSPPLWGDDVEFTDGSPTDVESISKDVAAFLMWTAEPKLEDRKASGLLAVLVLGILTVLLYLTNKKLWAPHKPKVTPAE